MIGWAAMPTAKQTTGTCSSRREGQSWRNSRHHAAAAPTATAVRTRVAPKARVRAAACGLIVSAVDELSDVAAATPANSRLSTVSSVVSALLGVKRDDELVASSARGIARAHPMRTAHIGRDHRGCRTRQSASGVAWCPRSSMVATHDVSTAEPPAGQVQSGASSATNPAATERVASRQPGSVMCPADGGPYGVRMLGRVIGHACESHPQQDPTARRDGAGLRRRSPARPAGETLVVTRLSGWEGLVLGQFVAIRLLRCPVLVLLHGARLRFRPRRGVLSIAGAPQRRAHRHPPAGSHPRPMIRHPPVARPPSVS